MRPASAHSVPVPEPASELEEIEITPEMTRAGLDALGDLDARFTRRSSIVEDIYEAMVRIALDQKLIQICAAVNPDNT